MSHKIAAALHQIMEKCAYVQKTGRNSFHNYTYAGEADLLAVLRPAMIDAGLILLPSVVDHTAVDAHGNTTIIMEYTLVHKDGDIWPHKICAIGTGNDMAKNGKIGDKGTYKALTGANKYLLFKLFQIETGDDPEHDDRKPGATDRDPIAEARKEIDPDGTAPSQYAVDKAKKAAANSDAGPVPPFLKRPVNGKPAPDEERLFVGLALEAFKVAGTKEDLSLWWKANRESMDKLSHHAHEVVLSAYDDRMDAVKARA